MSDKALKGQALFTIVLKYAQICLKPRKSATSGADKKSLTSTFTKNECIDIATNLKNVHTQITILWKKLSNGSIHSMNFEGSRDFF